MHSGTTDGNGGTDDAGMGASARADYSPSFLKTMSPEAQEVRITMQVEHMLVNDFLMDSRLSEVSTTCYMQWFSNAEWKMLHQAQPMKKRLLFRTWFFLLSVLRLFNILLSLRWCEAPRLPRTETGPRILPRYPETVWLRWAAVLVAQTG